VKIEVPCTRRISVSSGSGLRI